MTLNTLASSLATLALSPPSATRLALAAQVADAGRRHLAPIPTWVTGYLERCLSSARIACLPKEQLVEPLLTLHLLTGKSEYEREAITIINTCYRQIAEFISHPQSLDSSLFTLDSCAERPESGNALTTSSLISTLYVVATCCEYIEDYDPSLVLSAYHRLTSLLETSAKALDSSQKAKLLEIEEQLAYATAV